MTWRYFTRDEFACKGNDCCGGTNEIEDGFIDKLDDLRDKVGFPLIVTSGYRCPDHNDRVSSTGKDGPHTTGRAADLRVSRGNAYDTAHMAFVMGFTGIGFNQKGSGRFLHVDDLPNGPDCPRPVIWSY